MSNRDDTYLELMTKIRQEFASCSRSMVRLATAFERLAVCAEKFMADDVAEAPPD